MNEPGCCAELAHLAARSLREVDYIDDDASRLQNVGRVGTH